MITKYRLGAALIAVALSACAHVSTNPSQPVAQSYLGGQAGQPQSWTPNAELQAREAARKPDTFNEAHRGGRSGQPGSWTSSDAQEPKASPDYCYLGGRDAQPFSGPMLARVTETNGDELCERQSAGARL